MVENVAVHLTPTSALATRGLQWYGERGNTLQPTWLKAPDDHVFVQALAVPTAKDASPCQLLKLGVGGWERAC